MDLGGGGAGETDGGVDGEHGEQREVEHPVEALGLRLAYSFLCGRGPLVFLSLSL